MSATAAPPVPKDRQPEASGGWPLERVLFVLAGSVTGLSAVLSAVVSPWFLLLTGFVAVNQLLFASLGDCPASLILRKVFGIERGCNR